MKTITFKITKNIEAKVKNYVSGKQVIEFKSKKHSNTFTLYNDSDESVPCTTPSLTKVYENIKDRWKEQRNFQQFEDMIRFIKRHATSTVLKCLEAQLDNKKEFTGSQIDFLKQLIKTKEN